MKLSETTKSIVNKSGKTVLYSGKRYRIRAVILGTQVLASAIELDAHGNNTDTELDLFQRRKPNMEIRKRIEMNLVS